MVRVKLVLASTSPYRAALLETLKVPFQQLEPDYTESVDGPATPAETASRHAQGKALGAPALGESTLVCGADQVAVCNGTVLHKPGNAQRAASQLAACSGHWVEFTTGLCLQRAGQVVFLETESYAVRFRQLTPVEIDTYIGLDEPFHSAGSIKAESLGVSLLSDSRGRDINTLYGLPLMLFCDALASLGLSLPDFRDV